MSKPQRYTVQTTRITLHVWSTSLRNAIEQVLNYELCPLSAIVSIQTTESPL